MKFAVGYYTRSRNNSPYYYMIFLKDDVFG